jgi:hypothetical protein
MPQTKKQYHFLSVCLAILIILLAFSACGKRSSQIVPTPLPEQPPAQPSPTAGVERVMLIAPSDSDPAVMQFAEATLQELAAASALAFEKRESITANEIRPEIKIIVFLNHPDNLGSLAAGAPATQFISITDQDWNPGQNVSVIRTREDHTAFIAGYISAMLAPNFRAGALLPAEKPTISQAFINGTQYYCGLCASLIFPWTAYPVVSTQASASPAAAWQSGFDAINASKINVLYVANEAASPELLAYLAAQDIALIGSQTPAADGKPKWTATITEDGITPIREIWDDLLAGNGGKVLNATQKISDNQYVSVADGLVWLSQGKLDFAQLTIDALQDNLINPLLVN